MNCKIRVSPTVGGGFERSFQEAWGLEDYNPETDQDKEVVFAGCYGLPDFYKIWRHKGKKYVFWCGSDIRHLHNGYWLDDKGGIRLNSGGIAKWLNEYCENWVENKAEQRALRHWGIESKICPSFLGDVKQFDITYKHSDKPKLYSSVSGDDFVLYGWYVIQNLANRHPDVEFHLYGNEKDFPVKEDNIFVHGKVPKEQMNEETKDMQGALRLISMEGFSEIVAKSILRGQYPVSVIPYEHCLLPEQIDKLKDKKLPNIEGRDYYIKQFNNYPWNKNYEEV